MACAGSLAMENPLPDSSSSFADEGTLAHALAATCLEQDFLTSYFEGGVFNYIDHGVPKTATIDEDMVREVQKYIIAIRDYADGCELHVEQRLPFFVGEIPDQFGTSDAVIVDAPARELQVHDLKYGRGVQVFAENNEQLMLYALGALGEYDPLGDLFDTVLLVIHQPRLNHLDEWRVSVADLREFEQRALLAAKKALFVTEIPADEATKAMPFWLTPGEDQCRFCKAKGSCPSLRDKVLATVVDDFEATVESTVKLGKGEVAVTIGEAEKIIAAAHGVTLKAVDFADSEPPCFVVKKPTIRPVLDNPEQRIASQDDEHLAVCMDAIDLVEGWCKAVRAEAERRLLGGGVVPGYKLVQGKQGNRAWSDAEAVEAMLKSFRLKKEEMYDFNLIGPTTAEKLATAGVKGKPVIGEKQWAKVQALIVRRDGSPSVAPASDKRPALVITPVVDDFDEVQSADDLSDLI
jgi:hypothetical protein